MLCRRDLLALVQPGGHKWFSFDKGIELEIEGQSKCLNPVLDAQIASHISRLISRVITDQDCCSSSQLYC